MIVTVHSAGLQGLDAYPLEIEVDGAYGPTSVLIVGLPDKAVTESRERVQAAIGNGGYQFPQQRVTINLAPADIKKEGAAYDLPIALGLLAISHQLNLDALQKVAVIGELALDGRVRPVHGVLPIALGVRAMGIPALMVPAENAEEAAVVEGLTVLPVATLADAVGHLNEVRKIPPFESDTQAFFEQHREFQLDFADVRGQEHAKRAVEIAAAGGHNLLMIGPPGGGKTMIAKRVPSILPTLMLDEALETTKIHSIAGLTGGGQPLITTRPFRSPHHTISDAGLIGGGTVPRPGEVSLAHHGVLFLDELPEFNRRTLEVLRQPLEDGVVTIGRAAMTLSFPAEFMLVAAMNPCPCGYLGHPKKECTDTPRQVLAYRNRISGPLLDRIDLHLEVAPVPYDDLSAKRTGEPSRAIRARVQSARDIQAGRFQQTDRPPGARQVYCNAQMGERQVREHCKLSESGERLLRAAMDSLQLSARAYTRILKLSRTIADLEGEKSIRDHHLSEAINYRVLDRPMLESL